MSEEEPKKQGRPVNMSNRLKKALDEQGHTHGFALSEIIGKDEEYARGVLTGEIEVTRLDTKHILANLGLSRVDLGLDRI